MRQPTRSTGVALAAFVAVALGSWGVGRGAPDTERSVQQVDGTSAGAPALGSDASADSDSTTPPPEEASPNAFAGPAASAFGEIPVWGEPGGGQILGEATPQTKELVIDLALEGMPSDRHWALEVTYPASLLRRARAIPPARTAFRVEPPEPGKLVVRSASGGLAPDLSRTVVTRPDPSGEALLCASGVPLIPVGRFTIPLAERGELEGQDLPLELALRVPADEPPGPRPCVASARFHADLDRAARPPVPRRGSAR